MDFFKIVSLINSFREKNEKNNGTGSWKTNIVEKGKKNCIKNIYVFNENICVDI